MSEYEKRKVRKVAHDLHDEGTYDPDRWRSFDPDTEASYVEKISVPISVDRHQYRAYKTDEGEICLRPPWDSKRGFKPGDEACSDIPWDDYRYTHGGRIYRHAVELAKDIKDELKKHK